MITSTTTVGFRGGDAVVNGLVGFYFPNQGAQVPDLVPFFVQAAQQRQYLDAGELDTFLTEVSNVSFSDLTRFRGLTLETILHILAKPVQERGVTDPSATRQSSQKASGRNYGS